MNTADKSLIQMDTALRRRFAFMELMPNYDLDQINRTIGKVNLGKLLRTLNDKIRKENLRDKQIGHSYFMEIENTSNLQQVFKYEIIPLLQDYFYEDYNLLEKILGKNIISKNKMEINDKVVDFPDKLETELEKISDGVIETTNNSTDSDNSGQ
jgi:5-methylcytosine-specific restriction protein B